MPIQKSTQCTLIDAGSVVPVKQFRGLVRIARFDYTQVGAGNIGDQAELCDLPAGARIIAGLSYIRTSAGNASETISIGTRAHRNETTGAGFPLIAENATRFGTGIDADATPGFPFNYWSLGWSFFPGSGFFLPADDQDTMLGLVRVMVTFAGAGPPDGQKLSGEIAYVVIW